MTTWLYGLGDPLDRWTGDDKLAHLSSVLVEVIELVRWQSLTLARRYAIIGGRERWPWMADRVSMKDLAADGVGIALGAFVHAR